MSRAGHEPPTRLSVHGVLARGGYVVLSRASGVLIGMAFLGFAALAAHSARTPKEAAPITIDYPEDDSVFPPELLPPTFLFRDPSEGVAGLAS